MRLISILIFILLPLHASAEVKIALFSVVNVHNGEIVAPWPMFPEEERHHAVIEVNNSWYQMVPVRGVTKSPHLSDIMQEYSQLDTPDYRRQVEVFINPDLELEDIDLNNYKNVAFDLFGAWTDPASSHCTKFIAGIMGYKPLPSAGDITNLNLSPDDLFDILSSAGWELHSYSF